MKKIIIILLLLFCPLFAEAKLSDVTFHFTDKIEKYCPSAENLGCYVREEELIAVSLKNTPPSQLIFVLIHEIGHYATRNISDYELYGIFGDTRGYRNIRETAADYFAYWLIYPELNMVDEKIEYFFKYLIKFYL